MPLRPLSFPPGLSRARASMWAKTSIISFVMAVPIIDGRSLGFLPGRNGPPFFTEEKELRSMRAVRDSCWCEKWAARFSSLCLIAFWADERALKLIEDAEVKA